MYKRDLDGALPVDFTIQTIPCPPDCGGETYDEVEYIPICPKCRREFDRGISKYCPDCGQKLYGRVKCPKILEE